MPLILQDKKSTGKWIIYSDKGPQNYHVITAEGSLLSVNTNAWKYLSKKAAESAIAKITPDIYSYNRVAEVQRMTKIVSSVTFPGTPNF